MLSPTKTWPGPAGGHGTPAAQAAAAPKAKAKAKAKARAGSTPQTPKHQTPCRFVKSKEGCNAGKDCEFSHAIGPNGKHDPTAAAVAKGAGRSRSVRRAESKKKKAAAAVTGGVAVIPVATPAIVAPQGSGNAPGDDNDDDCARMMPKAIPILVALSS